MSFDGSDENDLRFLVATRCNEIDALVCYFVSCRYKNVLAVVQKYVTA